MIWYNEESAGNQARAKRSIWFHLIRQRKT